MRLEIPQRTNPNAYVYRMGFCYPICIWHRHDFLQARNTLAKTPLGWYTTDSYYYTANRIKPYYKSKEHSRWFAGQRKWQERARAKTDFWLVFRSESDRTVAMMYLG